MVDYAANAAQRADRKFAIIDECCADIVDEPIWWLWTGFLAMGKLSIIAGNSEAGKSFLAMDIAAHVTAGKPFVDGWHPPKGAVIILSAEDDPADTLKPRLVAAGADIERVFFPKAVSDGETDCPWTLEYIEELDNYLQAKRDAGHKVVMIIIDPLSAYHAVTTDTHRNAAVRAVLAPLGALAARWRLALVGIEHLNKDTSAAVQHRILGSVATHAAMRGGMLVYPSSDNADRRIVLPLKNSLGPRRTGLAFRLVPHTYNPRRGVRIETALPEWEAGEVDEELQDAMQGRQHSTTGEEQRASRFLVAALSGGPRPLSDIEKAAAEEGVSPHAMKRAKRKLAVQSLGDRRAVVWRLPGGGQSSP